MNNKRLVLSLFAATALLGACNDPPPATPDAGRDAAVTPDANVDGGGGDDDGGGGDVDAGTFTNDCAGYCAAVTAACSGDNAQYIDAADCMTQCTEMALPAGTPGATGGNTIACRIYHSQAAATMGAAVHCPHAGATGAGVCVGAAATFRSDAATAYTRVDRMGMPAVSTAVVPADSKDAYNDGDLVADASLMFAVPILTQLTAVHSLLDADLTTLSLTPCSMSETETVPGIPVPVPECAAQDYAPGARVVSLVVPDSLTINPAVDAGFPNGRGLTDPVIDVTLAVVLLDLENPTGCLGGPCTAGTLAGLPLNPPANDVAFSDDFPYLAAPHAP